MKYLERFMAMAAGAGNQRAREVEERALTEGLRLPKAVDVQYDGPATALTKPPKAGLSTPYGSENPSVSAPQAPLENTQPPAGELSRLLSEVAELYGCTLEERADMAAAASRDPERAVRSFKAMRAESQR
ncbi:MAG: hypothetical protein ACK515_03425 [bacterium]|jgi:hypothetical protein|nr:hypothetical protein [Betaproteobacteria bacterium]